MTHRPTLTYRERQEIADGIWQKFMLISDLMTLAFDEEGVTIRVPFRTPHSLGTHDIIYGEICGFNMYRETEKRRDG